MNNWLAGIFVSQLLMSANVIAAFPKTGSELYVEAQAYYNFVNSTDSVDEETLVKAANYSGFINGLAEMAFLQQIANRSPIFCLSDNFTVRQVSDLVFELLSENKDQLQEPVMPALATRLRERMPCND